MDSLDVLMSTNVLFGALSGSMYLNKILKRNRRRPYRGLLAPSLLASLCLIPIVNVIPIALIVFLLTLD